MRAGRNIPEKIRAVSNKITEKREHISIHVTGASCLGNTFLSLGKLLIGIYSLDFYTCVNGLYTLGMVFAKVCVLYGLLKKKKVTEQYHFCFISSFILVIASGAYITYSIRLLLHPQMTSYNEIVGITIATFTFAELGLNIRGVLVERKNKTPSFYMLKMINLSAALISLALTQTALLSFQEVNAEHSMWNGFIGILMGSLSGFLGILTIRKMQWMKKGGTDS